MAGAIISLNFRSCIGAYLGDLLDRMRTAGPEVETVSPILFSQAFGTLEQDFDGVPLDGVTSQDAWDFLMRLLRRQAEEVKKTGMAEDAIVQKFFGAESKSSVRFTKSLIIFTSMTHTYIFKYICSICKHTHTTPNDLLSLDISLPRGEEAIKLQACIHTYSKEVTPNGYKCEGCGKADVVTKLTKLQLAPQYLIINLIRTDEKGKIRTKTTPSKKVKICTWAGKVQYVVCSFVEHHGKRYVPKEETSNVLSFSLDCSYTDGHYTACKYSHDCWWKVDDTKVSKISVDDDVGDGTIFFLKKVG